MIQSPSWWSKSLAASLLCMSASVNAYNPDSVSLAQSDSMHYFGRVYVGARSDSVDVVFDTRSSWSGFVKSDASDEKLRPSNYDHTVSPSAQLMNLNVTEKIGKTTYVGEGVTDRMCLYQNGEVQRMCIHDQPIFEILDTADGAQSEFEGFIGLAPGYNNNVVMNLFDQKQITSAKVGIQYHTQTRSSITFGAIDYDEIENGINGLAHFLNAGGDKWGINTNSVTFNGNELLDEPQMAIIDSVGPNIQLPQGAYDNFLSNLMDVDETIQIVKLDDSYSTMIKGNCTTLFAGDIFLSFSFGKYLFKMRPEGFVIPSQQDEDECWIMVEPSDEDKIGLGIVFLLNYWVGFDFTYESIVLGLQRDNENAEIEERKEPPHKVDPKKDDKTIVPKKPAKIPTHEPTFFEAIWKDCTDMFKDPFGTVSNIFNGLVSQTFKGFSSLDNFYKVFISHPSAEMELIYWSIAGYIGFTFLSGLWGFVTTFGGISMVLIFYLLVDPNVFQGIQLYSILQKVRDMMEMDWLFDLLKKNKK